MASGKILRQLIKAGANGDTAAFRQASEAIIQEEREKQQIEFYAESYKYAMTSDMNQDVNFFFDKFKQGIELKGVFETRGAKTTYSEYPKMKKEGIDVVYIGGGEKEIVVINPIN